MILVRFDMGDSGIMLSLQRLVSLIQLILDGTS